MSDIDPYIEGWRLRQLVVKKELRPREVAEFFVARIQRINPELNAYQTVALERATADAARLERSYRKASVLPLFGVAYSLKDLTWTKDIVTTMGSANYSSFRPPADGEMAVRLREAGGILLGKTTTPEFGGRPTTEGGYCGAARNPWNPAHSTGGSSGGAAAAVAAGMGPLAEGSDGGGSIRIPSSCCGTVGLKPGRGRLSMSPVAGEAWAGYATSGPIARCVRDVALMLDVMAGPVDGDPYWAAPPKKPFAQALKARPRGLKLATLCETAVGAVDPEVAAAFEEACKVFKKMGHRLTPVKIDPAARLLKSSQTIIAAGLGSTPVPNPELMDPIVRVMYDRGLQIGAAEYLAAVLEMHNTSREIVQELMPYDALLTPTLTKPAVKIGTMPSSVETYNEDVFGWLPFTFPFNATGQPAFSVPNGFTKDGLPIGLQIVGRPADEAGIIPIAAAWEEARPWKDQKPALE